jgi:hypothetical protein
MSQREKDAKIGDRPIIEKGVAKVLVICKGGF